MRYLFIPIISLILGVLAGSALTFTIPVAYAKYLSIAVLAALDTLFGGIRAMVSDEFDGSILLAGFFSNTILAAALAFLGDQIGVDLYLAAVIALGIRLFTNAGIIRRTFIQNMKNRNEEKKALRKQKRIITVKTKEIVNNIENVEIITFEEK